jgi:phytoene desaturase
MTQQAIVIGSGIGGIAAALHLVKKGLKVKILELNDFPGGKLAEFRNAGFRFDAGPSLFTLPDMVDELFQMFGEDARAHFEYKKLEIICRYFYPDGTKVNAFQDAERLDEEFRRVMGEDAGRLQSFLQKSRNIYELTSGIYIFRSFHRLSTFFSRSFINAIFHWRQLDAFRTMHRANASWFHNPKTVQLFDRYATYNGSDPYVAPATLNVIPHLEHSIGAFFPVKGMADIIDSLLKLAMRHGVEIIYNAAVTRILHSNGIIKGVTTQHVDYQADVVVSDIDVHKLYPLLSMPLPSRYDRAQRSTSALIFYWGISSRFRELELHNIFFSSDYRKEFECLFRHKSIFHDPTVYLFISSKMVKEDAPEGCENWFVMINVPENIGQDWDSLINEARKTILSKLTGMLKIPIESFIQCEQILDPRTIEKRTGSFRGSLYGISSNSRFSIMQRHPNFSKRIRGLYFVGGSVHPGGGIPLCLASARIMADTFKGTSKKM